MIFGEDALCSTFVDAEQHAVIGVPLLSKAPCVVPHLLAHCDF